MGLIDSIRSLFGAKPKAKAKSSSRGKSGASQQGEITYFNHKKGFGFITIKGEETQVFLHISEINGRPRKGLMVDFEIMPDPKGDRAVNVVPAD